MNTEVKELNKKGMEYIITKELTELRKALEYEIESIEWTLNRIENGKGIDTNELEYIIHDLWSWPLDYGKYNESRCLPHETLCCNFTTLETILKEIKGHD